MANCAGSTLSKYNTGLTHTAHCAGSSANTTQDSHTQHTALAVVQTQHRSYNHSTQLTHTTSYIGSTYMKLIQYSTKMHDT